MSTWNPLPPPTVSADLGFVEAIVGAVSAAAGLASTIIGSVSQGKLAKASMEAQKQAAQDQLRMVQEQGKQQERQAQIDAAFLKAQGPPAWLPFLAVGVLAVGAAAVLARR